MKEMSDRAFQGSSVARLVFPFSEGDRTKTELLGGKGANLAEMVGLGIPVPDGFTITTDACREFLRNPVLSASLIDEILAAIEQLEKNTGKKFGSDTNPLLVSVRSGAKFSMPGMMETVLNVGMSETVAQSLERITGDSRFAWDSYRRFIEMFGKTVVGVSTEELHHVTSEFVAKTGKRNTAELESDELRALGQKHRRLVESVLGSPFPDDAFTQLKMSVIAVFRSWNSERAQIYRKRERISSDLGTAVNIQAMVFGNFGDDSGTGVCFTRNPSTGEGGHYGDYLPRAQGEDVVAGIRNTFQLDYLAKTDELSYNHLLRIMKQLEDHFKDMCDIEFTIESGKLWILQTRVGKRTAEAAFRIATQLVDESVITLDQALLRVNGEHLVQLMFPQFDLSQKPAEITRGIAASPGAAVGTVVFDPYEAANRALEGERVILVRRETNPDDLPGMVAAKGILTSRGGKTSHAAVVARGMGRPAVCGADGIEVNVAEKFFTCGSHVVRDGDLISIDGATGAVYLGEVPVVASSVTNYLLGNIHPDRDAVSPVVASIHRLMMEADGQRRLKVRANADTPEDAALARKMGAEGIGLTRTEHMFLGERRTLVERLVLAHDAQARDVVLDEMESLQFDDFVGILTEMSGLPVTIRLLDPPLHEFLSSITELSVEVARQEERGEAVSDHKRLLLKEVMRLHESNPMMGFRGVRLGVIIPELYRMQVRALTRAAIAVERSGKPALVEVMIPLVASQRELLHIRSGLEDEIRLTLTLNNFDMEIKIGSMIETPRAAITADRLSLYSDFFSFGTNDLTQLTWAFSRDDVEASFLPRYIDLELIPFSPFESLDTDGVGLMVTMACARAREVKPDISLGVCGEHGGDPASIDFFHRAGLSYVSCSPFRVPVARLEAGRAALADRIHAGASTI